MTARIIAYFALIAVALAAFFLMTPWPPRPQHIALALLFLVPGRIQGILWRSFFRGRHAMNKRDYAVAEEHFRTFLEQLSKRPWLKYAVFLAWSFYTWNAEAMARNNLGSCYLLQGKLELAEAALSRARDLDAGFAVPYYNLAVLAQVRAADQEAERLRAHAAALGYRAGTRERVIAAAGSILAAVEGQPAR